jgi:hypothetical protein
MRNNLTCKHSLRVNVAIPDGLTEAEAVFAANLTLRRIAAQLSDLPDPGSAFFFQTVFNPVTKEDIGRVAIKPEGYK